MGRTFLPQIFSARFPRRTRRTKRASEAKIERKFFE
ncbi:hypothetical protein BIFADO_00281 [Bifidobacterium adolescentis L2-32]|uniref:Uncharacterized protein n=1 Tax=Bifidobacterium adolescentis L2-32 TaxID=411481 RepID=A7A391_BIFAD|nr:hypothetical protein BIFADO_00281 [Bifidobacterium adolescentis L2-32]